MHHVPGQGSIVCHRAGIVEPITWSIFLLLSREGAELDGWVDEALERDSLPLVARIDIALRLLSSSGGPDIADWASATLEAIALDGHRRLALVEAAEVFVGQLQLQRTDVLLEPPEAAGSEQGNDPGLPGQEPR